MLAIQDLVLNEEMSKEAMMGVFGGGHGIGRYLHFHNGPWVNTYRRSFTFRRYVGRRAYKYRQYQWTWKRIQVAHRGHLRFLGRVRA